MSQFFIFTGFVCVALSGALLNTEWFWWGVLGLWGNVFMLCAIFTEDRDRYKQWHRDTASKLMACNTALQLERGTLPDNRISPEEWRRLKNLTPNGA